LTAARRPLHHAAAAIRPDASTSLIGERRFDRSGGNDMLRGIDPILGPDLLFTLRAMGHGDEIAIVDANFPALGMAKRLIRLDGHDAVRVTDAILSLMPLDRFVPAEAAIRMEVVGDPHAVPPVCATFQEVMDRRDPGYKLARLERFAFYERAKACFAIVATGERRLYGNIILKMGVIDP
jgi:L-fucose mutarotase